MRERISQEISGPAQPTLTVGHAIPLVSALRVLGLSRHLELARGSRLEAQGLPDAGRRSCG